eukprot:gene21070-27300_t
MSLWVDKYKPSTLSRLSLHQELSNKLIALSKSDELPHLLFYGPPGSGKKTRIMCLLKEIYGSNVEKVKIENRVFKTSTNRVIEINTLASNYHIECNPSDAGSGDRFVIQEVIKEIASHTNINNVTTNAKSFKIVVLSEVDKLSKQAQAGLRRTMEKYASQCRVILLCNNASKVIEPIRSRCLGIRVPSPSLEEISDLLLNISKKESCTCPQELAIKISIASERNVRRAVLMLETCRVQSGSNVLNANLPVPLPDWELYIGKLAREILAEQTPSKLQQSREMLYELLTNCIPADIIFQTLVNELMKSLDDTLKHEVIYWAAFYDHRLRQGSKEIFHLEAFIAKFMAIYKQWLVMLFA